MTVRAYRSLQQVFSDFSLMGVHSFFRLPHAPAHPAPSPHLRCTRNHVGDKVLVPGGIQKRNPAIRGLKIRHTWDEARSVTGLVVPAACQAPLASLVGHRRSPRFSCIFDGVPRVRPFSQCLNLRSKTNTTLLPKGVSMRGAGS